MEQAAFYTVFKIDSQLYGIDIKKVERITRASSITSVPHGPESLLGLLNVGGTMIPVVDIRKKFCLDESEIKAENRIIFFQTKKTLCFFVDAVEGVAHFSPGQLQIPQEIHPTLEHYIEGVGQYNTRSVILIDLARFFNDTELIDMAKIADQHAE